MVPLQPAQDKVGVQSHHLVAAVEGIGDPEFGKQHRPPGGIDDRPVERVGCRLGLLVPAPEKLGQHPALVPFQAG